MNRLTILSLFLTTALFAGEVAPPPLSASSAMAGFAADPAPCAGIAGCEVATPTGDYAVAILACELPGEKGSATWTVVGGLRGGRMAMHDGNGLRETSGWLERKGDKLIGTYRRPNLSSMQRGPVIPGGTISVDALIGADGAVSGTVAIEGRAGTLKGSIVSSVDLVAKNAVPKEATWPAAQGPIAGGCSATPSGVPTIDEIAAARLVWRCEENDIGRGMGNVSRMMNQWKEASAQRSSSGCASPLLHEGRIYVKYFVPAPGAGTDPAATHANYGATEAAARVAMLDEAKKAGVDTLPTCALEKIAVAADDVVLCLDAATGATIWKAVMRGRGRNWQHHKAGPFDMSPAIGGGRIFALGTGGWLYAFDARTGKPLWEVEAGYDGSNALLLAGEVIVAPAGEDWGGYAAATGKLLWRSTTGRSVSTLSAWVHGENHRLIGRLGTKQAPKNITCLDAATGTELWNRPIQVLTIGCGLGPGGITISGDHMVAYEDEGPGGKGPPKAVLAAYRLTPAEPEPLWRIAHAETDQTSAADDDAKGDTNIGKYKYKYGPVHDESVPVVVHGAFVFTADLRVVELASGKVVGRAQGFVPKNGGYMQAMDDLVLVRVDGTHGHSMPCAWYKVAKDGSARCISGPSAWFPPIGGSTSSYHHPLFYPMGAGRVFLRQDDGIYCWDLRAAR